MIKLLLVCHPDNMRIHVTGNILKLNKPRTAFESICSRMNHSSQELTPVTLAQDVLSPSGKEPGQIVSSIIYIYIY